MPDEMYFFDTYAIIDILKGNPSYNNYKDKKAIITKLNIFELFYSTLNEQGEEAAEKSIALYYPLVVEYGEEIIKEAAKFRLLHKKQDLSMTDCIGYIIAKKLNVKFLTGDKEFHNMPNVEFVK